MEVSNKQGPRYGVRMVVLLGSYYEHARNKDDPMCRNSHMKSAQAMRPCLREAAVVAPAAWSPATWGRRRPADNGCSTRFDNTAIATGCYNCCYCCHYHYRHCHDCSTSFDVHGLVAEIHNIMIVCVIL